MHLLDCDSSPIQSPLHPSSEGWLKRKTVATAEAAVKSQREAARQGNKGTVVVDDWVVVGGDVRKGGTATVGSDEGCGRGRRCGCVAAAVAGEAECYSRGGR
ncbi:hypothetical protein BHE74_00040416 [Ensete ventricosum]|nr:hypothetical protein BHE74_00040416 [Ensete ventricosum]